MAYLSAVISKRLDKILVHKVWGMLIFLFLMWLMFFCTFTLGKVPQGWIELGVSNLSDYAQANLEQGDLKDLLIDGIINGVGSVIVFLPNILILFLFIALFEESGYMTRAGYLMDRYMHKIGLHGQSFLPLIMGFGCNVPAILSTQTIPDRNYRLLTMLINPFMSCSARLPVYILLIGAFFPEHPVLTLVSIYSLGIVVAIGMALFLKRFLIPIQVEKGRMHYILTPYTIPSFKNTLGFMAEKALQYLKKISGVVLVAVIIIWALNYFPRSMSYSKNYDAMIADIEKNESGIDSANVSSMVQALVLEQRAEHQANSYLGKIGHFIEPAMRPLGFDWKMSIALLSGLPAKEFVVSTLGVIYQVENSDENSSLLISRLQNEVYTSGPKVGQKTFNTAVSAAFLVFVLLYFPCIASVAAIRKESGSWGWALFAVFYTTALAWIMAFLVYRGILLFM